ncbi:hypothetical protein, partial [Thermomonas sp.]|uniref:hypothetical protein n=1 Tax=Thermomonas sp. TaxID=1971895 RepID=UPI00260D7917
MSKQTNKDNHQSVFLLRQQQESSDKQTRTPTNQSFSYARNRNRPIACHRTRRDHGLMTTARTLWIPP